MTSFASLRQLGIYVIGILRSFKIGAVATRTGVWGSSIVPIDVTSRTIVFNREVRSGQFIVLIVIKRRWTPTFRGMTTLTSSWKLGSLMIWFFCSSIIGGMASSAGGWGVAINIPLMTGRTIVGNRFMLAFQYIIFIVIGE
jgi:hypothetical protein